MQSSIIQSRGAVKRAGTTSRSRPNGQFSHSRLREREPHTMPFTPEPFIAVIGPGKTVLTCRASQVLFSQGAPADAVFYLQAGRVKLTVVSPDGKEAVLAILDQDSFFGESCLANQPLYLSTALALTPCTLVRIDKRTMTSALQREPTVAERFLNYLLTHNIRVVEDVVDQLFNSSEQRLARALLLLADTRTEGKLKPINPKISQQTLAEMIGTTRSRVSFFMNKFRKLGFIAYKGGKNQDSGLHVHRSLLNVVRHD